MGENVPREKGPLQRALQRLRHKRDPFVTQKFIRKWCCCCGCCSGAQSNKILPVTSGPTQCDFLEIRPHRRIRVVHLRGGGEDDLDPVKAGLRRSATTLSRTLGDFRDGKCEIQRNGSAVKFDKIARESSDSDEEEDDDEYWFENAAPKRPQIQVPTHIQLNRSRIINKFEPQSPPRIAGIRPPKASVIAASLQKSQSEPNLAAAASNAANSDSSPLQKRAASASTSPAARLPRKVILAEDADLEDDEDDDLVVNDRPNDDDRDDDDDEGHVPENIVEEGFVANVLSEMSDMVIQITADATDGKNLPGNKEHEFRAASPTNSDDGRVTPEPDPNPGQQSEHDDTQRIVGSGHLGGVANVAFEEEEDEVIVDDIPDGGHESDAYRRLQEENEIIPQQQQEPVANNTGEGMTRLKKPNPVLFFIHGVGGSGDTWITQLEYFSQLGYEVVAPDLLGHGFSSVPDSPKSYLFTKLFNDLLVIFDHYVLGLGGLDREAVIVAHSYGCSFAAALARTRPANVRQLVMLACGGPTALAPPPTKAVKKAENRMRLLRMMICWKKKRKKRYDARSAVGKTIKVEESFEMPSYVFKHIMNGQRWPEGQF